MKLTKPNSGKRGRPAKSEKILKQPIIKQTPKQLHEQYYITYDTLDLAVIYEYNEIFKYWRHRGYYCRDCLKMANNPSAHASKCIKIERTLWCN